MRVDIRATVVAPWDVLLSQASLVNLRPTLLELLEEKLFFDTVLSRKMDVHLPFSLSSN